MYNPYIVLLASLGIGALIVFIAIGVSYLFIPRWVNAYLRDLAQAKPEPARNDRLKAEDKAFLDRVAKDL